MTAAVGAALRIAAEQDVDVSAEQLRAVLRDTAQRLRSLQDDAAWRTVAVASGNPTAYRSGYVQAIELIEQSAEEGMGPLSAPPPGHPVRAAGWVVRPASLCVHGYRLTDSCPGCDDLDDRALSPTAPGGDG